MDIPPTLIPQEKRAYIYLLQEKHELLRKSSVYKVGKTIAHLDDPLQRLQAYRGGVDLIFILQVPLTHVDALEQDIKLYLTQTFGPPVSGSESFEAPLDKLKSAVAELCFQAPLYPGGIIQQCLKHATATASNPKQKKDKPLPTIIKEPSPDTYASSSSSASMVNGSSPSEL